MGKGSYSPYIIFWAEPLWALRSLKEDLKCGDRPLYSMPQGSYALRKYLFFSTWLFFRPNLEMNFLPWAQRKWQGNQHSYTINRALSQCDLSFPLIVFFLLVLICLLLIVPLCYASNDFAWEDEKFIQYLKHSLKEELKKIVLIKSGIS